MMLMWVVDGRCCADFVVFVLACVFLLDAYLLWWLGLCGFVGVLNA